MLAATASLLPFARLTIEALRPREKRLTFGAIVRGLKLPPSQEELLLLEEALTQHGLLLLEGAAPPDSDPFFFAQLVKRLNPGAQTVWRDQQTNPWERYKAESAPAGTFQLPGCSDVLVLGKGELRDHFGLSCTLGGKRPAYGSHSGSQVIGGGSLQWHLDGAFWDAPSTCATGLPCRVVGMRCVEAPALRTVGVDYGDGASLPCPAGATAFCSGVLAFALLTPLEQERALRTTIVYAAHPFKRYAKCGMTRDGLRCVGAPEVESAIDDADNAGQLRLPLVWTHPISGARALMPHTRCLERLEVAASPDGTTPTTVLDTDAARGYLHGLMRRAIDPELVFALGWRPGDCAIWDNHAVWHSATGGLGEDERRVMHLVAYDGVDAPRVTSPSDAPGRAFGCPTC